ncbi:MAG: 2-oxo acid dehydrogenase subunit E2, partial [Anaerolineales bacterium]
IRPMMDISLTFDHRLIDGALGARFLQRLKAHLESYETDMQV